MTDPKYPALLAAERWFATEQAKSDIATARSMTFLGRGTGWLEETLRGLARIAFVVGYEAGKRARGASVAAFITLAAQVARGDDEREPD